MLQYFDTLTDDSGNCLFGATLKITAYPGGGAATIYQTNGTLQPIANSTVQADITGQVQFFIPDGAYIFTYSFNGTQYKVRSPVQVLDPIGLLPLTDTGNTPNVYVVSDQRIPAQLINGERVTVTIANTNTGAATLNVNSTGNQPIQLPGGASTPAGVLLAGGIYSFIWESTAWQMLSVIPVNAAVIGTFLYPQLAFENGLTVVNFQYPYGIIDRYKTNTTPGTTDMTAPLAAANTAYTQGGPPITMLGEVYAIASNVSVSAPLINLQGGAGYFKPANGVVMAFTGSIVAGPYKIFDVSNTAATGILTAQTSLQTGVTPIAGPSPVDKIYAEWFGATGGNSGFNDGAPIQAALNFGMSSYGVPVQLQAKIYYTTQTLYAGGNAYQLGTGGGGQTALSSSLYGISGQVGGTVGTGVGGKRGTKITDNGSFLTPGTPLVRFRNLPSYDAHTEVRDITFDSIASTSNAAGIEFAGACFYRAVNCRFAETGLYEAVRWNNSLDSGTNYTEYCILEKCEVFGLCSNCVGHFVGNVADASYHGNGFSSRCLLSADGTSPVVLIDPNAQWYNGVLDAQIFGSNYTLISNNSTFTNCSASGSLTLETGGSGTVTLGGTNNFFFMGDVRVNAGAANPNVVAGTLLRCRAGANNNVGTFATTSAERGSTFTGITTGANTLTTHSYLAGCARKVICLVLGAGGSAYQYWYEITVVPQAGSNAVVANATGAAPTALVASNGGGYAVPAFSGNTSGNIVLTLTGTLPPTVTVYLWEQQMSNTSFGTGVYANI